jgi:hypothetical protein
MHSPVRLGFRRLFIGLLDIAGAAADNGGKNCVETGAQAQGAPP